MNQDFWDTKYKKMLIYEPTKLFAYEVNFAEANTIKEFCNKHL